MNKIQHLYVNGDSFAFGQELGGSDVSHDVFYTQSAHQREHCYSGIIAKHYNIVNYTNNARPGGSNDRVVRTTLSDMSALLTKHKPSDIFALIAFTDASRREFYHAPASKYVDYLNNHGPGIVDKEFTALWNVYTAYFDAKQEAINRKITQRLCLQSFFKATGIPYLFTYSLHVKDHELIAAEGVNALIDFVRAPLLEFGRFSSAFAKSHPHLGGLGKYKHPLENCHAAWAQKLIAYIDEHNLLDDVFTF